MKKVFVSKSAIAGKGLFASETIRPGDDICEYVGELISNEENGRRELAGRGFYAVAVPSGVIDSYDRKWDNKCLAKFSNDASGPIRVPGAINNATFRYTTTPGGFRVFIVATRHIKPGAEIFTSYGRKYWSDYIKHANRRNI